MQSVKKVLVYCYWLTLKILGQSEQLSSVFSVARLMRLSKGTEGLEQVIACR